MPTPTRCRSAVPVGTLAARRRRAGRPDSRGAPLVCGVAHTFNTLTRFRAEGVDRRDLDRFGALAGFVRPSAVDASLRLADAGEGGISLLFDHDPAQELASTADGSLAVFRDATSLYFLVRTDTARGRVAARRIAARPDRRECSIGGDVVCDRMTRLNRGPEWALAGLDLNEISIVRSGANPGTRVRVS